MIEFNWPRDSFETGSKAGPNCLHGLIDLFVLKSRVVHKFWLVYTAISIKVAPVIREA